MDVVKGAKDIAKEMLGVNDFKKAKDAFDRAGATAKGVDGDISDAVGALPSYTKDIAVGVGNVAVGAGKALVNLIPGKKVTQLTGKVADVGAKTALNAFKPKAYAPSVKPPVKTPSRQFAPKPAEKAPTKPRYSDDTLPTKPAEKSTGGYPVTPKSATAPKAPTKTTPKKTGLGRAGAFTAGALLAGDDDKPKTGNWTASAVV